MFHKMTFYPAKSINSEVHELPIRMGHRLKITCPACDQLPTLCTECYVALCLSVRPSVCHKSQFYQTVKLIIKPRLHDEAGCSTGCLTGLTTSWTTGCIVYTHIQPVDNRLHRVNVVLRNQRYTVQTNRRTSSHSIHRGMHSGCICVVR